MRPYNVSFWSGQQAHLIACDIEAADARGLLEGFARAGRYAIELRAKSLPATVDLPDHAPTAVELAWLVCACGPVWLFAAATYWFG